MSRERKHWLQQFHMIFVYCVWCHLRLAIILEDSHVVLSNNCISVLKLLQTLLNPRNISGDLCIKPRVNSTPSSKDYLQDAKSVCQALLVMTVCVLHDWPFATADDANKMIPTTVLAHQRAPRVLLTENIKIHPITSTCGQAQKIMIIDRTKSNLWLF